MLTRLSRDERAHPSDHRAERHSSPLSEKFFPIIQTPLILSTLNKTAFDHLDAFLIW